MFEIREAYEIGPNGDKLMAVDDSRDVWLQRITTRWTDNPPMNIFKLVWKGRVIPFEVLFYSAEHAGEMSIVYEFGFFGMSNDALFYGINPYKFSGDNEKEAAAILAIEATLLYRESIVEPNNIKYKRKFIYKDKIYTIDTFC